MAIRTTSRGSVMIYSPFNENMTTMVKRRAMRVMGLILGTNTVSYHSFPFHGMSVKRVIIPPKKGMPR
jgi:hypothetical protein